MNILHALDDEKVFAPFFRGDTWSAWRVFLAALFGLPLTGEQLTLYTKHTGRTKAPTSPLHEAWLCIGRRGGKSFILAVVAVFLACFKDWRPYLGPGEVATIMIIARDRRQARVIKRFITGLLKAIPMLARVIEGETQETIALRNSVSIEIHTASFRSTRGYTIVAALLDEIAYWEVDENSSEPDIEVINAIRPGQATVPGAMLLCASSPHARKGALWSAYSKHFGKDNDEVLVWQASTRDMNASVRQSYIDMHVAEDPSRASAEYMAQFRTDIESFIARQQVEACIEAGVHERPPASGVRYFSFTDPSGGSADSMVCAVGHMDSEMLVVDAVREIRSPFDPESAVEEIAQLLALYNVSKTTGDRYSAQWCAQSFEKRSIRYENCEQNKSQLYVEMLPRINAKTIRLLDHPRAINQICMLERRTMRGGRDSIDHPPGTHDDCANAIAGLCGIAGIRRYRYPTNMDWVSGPTNPADQNEAAFAASSTRMDAIVSERS
jgi:hypothetical protein